MTTFRTMTNRAGIVYNADKTEVLFAEDVNAITEAINDLEESASSENSSDQTTATTITADGTVNNHFNLSAQASALTIANPSGTLSEGKVLTVRIKDNGTARGITFGSKFVALGVTLPTTTVISKKMLLGCIFNAGLDKVEVVSVINEA